MNQRKLAFGAMISIASNITKSLLLFLLLPVLAKLVGPTEYGLYSMVLPAVMFVTVIADGGLGMSLAREKDDTSPVWSSAYILLTGLAAVLASFLVLYAWVLSGSLQDNRLVFVTAILSASLFFTALSVVPAARLVRKSDVQMLALIDFASFFVGSALALILAILKYGVWSLVAQQVGGAFCRALLMNLRAPPLIRIVFSLSDLKPHLALGGAVGFSRLADFGGRMIEMVILSGSHGGSLNGLFGFGNQVGKFATETIINPIWSIMYIMGLHTTDEGIHRLYFRLTRVITILLLPVAALVFMSAADLIRLTMGPEWGGAAQLIIILTPSLAIGGIASVGSSLMYSHGLAKEPLALNLELVVLRILAVFSLPLFGWEFMIFALAAGYIAYAGHSFWVVQRKYGWNMGELLIWAFRPMAASIAAAFVYRFVLNSLNPNLTGVLISIMVAGISYIVLLTALDARQVLGDTRAFVALLKGKSLAAVEGG